MHRNIGSGSFLVLVFSALVSGCSAHGRADTEAATAEGPTGSTASELRMLCGDHVRRAVTGSTIETVRESYESALKWHCADATLVPGVITAETLVARKKQVFDAARKQAFVDCKAKVAAVIKAHSCPAGCTASATSTECDVYKTVEGDPWLQDDCVLDPVSATYARTWVIGATAYARATVDLDCKSGDAGVADTAVGAADSGALDGAATETAPLD